MSGLISRDADMSAAVGSSFSNYTPDDFLHFGQSRLIEPCFD
jgi:hypothetical protein